jgi:hypothetical protein
LLDTVSLQAASDRIATAATAAQPHPRACRTTLSLMVFVHPCDARYFSAGFSEESSGPEPASSNAAPRRSPLLKGNGNLTNYLRPGQWSCRTSHCHTQDIDNGLRYSHCHSITHLTLIGQNQTGITTPRQSPSPAHSNFRIPIIPALMAAPISRSTVHTRPVIFAPRFCSILFVIL